MAEQEFDRNEEATPYKLEQARKQGNVAKSQDFTYAAVLSGFVLFLYSRGWQTINEILQLLQGVLANFRTHDWSVSGFADWFGQLLVSVTLLILPLLLLLMLSAILGVMSQTGVVLSTKPLGPDFNKLNPAQGFKKIFSLRVLYEGGKSVLKLFAVSIVLMLAIIEIETWLIGLPYIETRIYAKMLLDQTSGVLFKLLLVMITLALLDMAYVRWEFSKQMRMSKREIKDEYKQREGDPRIRSRLRELRNEMLKRTRGLPKLPEADVLITNPVHYAVAIKYQHGSMAAPQLLVKGAGDLAAKMRELANKHSIIIVQNPPLAREIYRRVEADEYVPEDLYPQLARILLWVYAMRKTHAGAGRVVK